MSAPTNIVMLQFFHVPAAANVWAECCLFKPSRIWCICALCLSFDSSVCCAAFGLPTITFPVDWSRLEAPVGLSGKQEILGPEQLGPHGVAPLGAHPRLLMSLSSGIKRRLNTFGHQSSLSFILPARRLTSRAPGPFTRGVIFNLLWPQRRGHRGAGAGPSGGEPWFSTTRWRWNDFWEPLWLVWAWEGEKNKMLAQIWLNVGWISLRINKMWVVKTDWSDKRFDHPKVII